MRYLRESQQEEEEEEEEDEEGIPLVCGPSGGACRFSGLSAPQHLEILIRQEVGKDSLTSLHTTLMA